MSHEIGRGGHFPAAAEPELLAQTLREEGLALGALPVRVLRVRWARRVR